MTLKVDVETVDSVRRRLAVEVPAEAVAAELEKTYGELARAAKVRGFRQGHVPRPVLERMFGDRVRADVFAKLIQQSYAEVLQSQQIEAVGPPEIVTQEAEPGHVLRYSATVEVKPEVVVENYNGIEVERPEVTVSEADVDTALERLRQASAQVHPVIGRSQVEAGDVVTLDYEAHVDGRLLGRGEKRQVEVGASSFPPEFDQQLIGKEIGTAYELAVPFPADHPNAELAGKTVQFHMRLHGVARKELAPLDDEFAKDHGECGTLAELRQRVRERLEAEATRRADEAMRRGLLTTLVSTHDIVVPQALVQQRSDALVAEVVREWQQQGVRPKREAEAIAHLRAELQPRAREQVQIGLLLEAIARQEGITVSDADIEGRVDALAAEVGTAAERVRAVYRDEEARQQLRVRMLQARALDVVARRARPKPVSRADRIAEASENG